MTLSELESLGVSSNFLIGKISETHLKNLSRLVYLDLSNNTLGLEIEFGWSPSFSLDVVSLSSCKLGPAFPAWLQPQKNFSIIDISNAHINDSVPACVLDITFGDQPIIDLSSNDFSGSIPLFPRNTQTLVLYNNMFSRSVFFLCHFTTIGQLDLSKNQLSGDLPNCWMNLTRLFYLNLESNKFSGRILTTMGSLTNMSMLSMRANSLTGELPSSLQNCTLLILLDVGENNISGRIPAWIGNPIKFACFKLDIKSFPWYHAYKLLHAFKDADLGHLGKQYFWNHPKVPKRHERHDRQLAVRRATYVFKSLLEWKGRKSEYNRTLFLVRSLDLSSNMFTGEIPDEITNLSGLVALNLSRNNLTSEFLKILED
ncbi:leucine-rich repeat protein [Artemisia annua]|uniref:Leucine-rich repeat protein n=1 Tax=Artemisia annua TaxID=35608 RepID=A0A2U1PMS1_ARTAN|nr:leucine-rich repeat protein [Artemisia annua]